MRLTTIEMLRLNNAQLKGKLAESNLDAIKYKTLYNQLLIQFATKELEGMVPQIAENESLTQEGKEQFDAVVAKAESRLGVSLSDYTFDEQTGALSPVKSEEK